MVQLQRAAGNRASAHLLRAGGPLPRPALVLQRQSPLPPAYGLDTPANQNKYVTLAAQIWQTQKDMSLEKFADKLMQTIADELAANGVPLFNWKLDRGLDAAGLFDSHDWVVTVNPDRFGANPDASVVGDLTLAEVTDAVGTLYHEARHTDQDVLIVRVLLDRKKSVDDIVAATKIRKNVVEKIRDTKFSEPLDAAKIAHADRMFDVMYGEDRALLEFLMSHLAAFAGIVALKEPNSVLGDAKPHIETFADWQKGVLKSKVDALKATKKRSATQDELLRDLQDVNSSLSALVTAWTKATSAKASASDAAAVRRLAATFVQKMFDAQAHLEGERDAYRVEGKVKEAFGKAASKKKK